jgi:micrococcal nuclease
MLTGVITYGTAYAQKAECIGTASCIVGKVKRIVDGDTLVVGQKTIRLSLTNTPEKNQSGFKEAKTFTSKICPVGSTVTVDQDDTQRIDKYKRTLGKVICSGKVLNAELLYSGHAKILKSYCDESEFAGERWAKKYGCAQLVQKKNDNKQTPSAAKSPTTAPPAQTKASNNSCDPSYPDVCIPPSPPDLDCGDISHRNFKVLPPDPHRFDSDKDGVGCER